jgi:hypothetical protein
MTGMAPSAGSDQATAMQKKALAEPFFCDAHHPNNPFTIFVCAALTLLLDILAQNPGI